MAAKNNVGEVKETKEQRFKRTACDKLSAKVGYAEGESARKRDDAWWQELGEKCRFQARNAIPVLVAIGGDHVMPPKIGK